MAHLVLTVHGIRTYGDWQERLAAALRDADAHIEVRSYKYNYFSVVGFLLPLVRWFATRNFQRQLLHVCQERAWDRIDIVAHSFGTHLVAWALYRLSPRDRPAIHTMVLAGSVLRSSFPWTELCPSTVRRVVNECGLRDWALVFSQMIGLFTGMAGREGFIGWRTQAFKNRYFNHGHSGYFTGRADFIEQHWVPLLTGDGHIPDVNERPPLTWWRGAAEVLIRNLSAVKILIYVIAISTVAYGQYARYDRERNLRLQAQARLQLLQAAVDQWLNPQRALTGARNAIAQDPTPEAQNVLRTAEAQVRAIAVLEQPNFAPVSSAVFSDDGNYVVAADNHANICLWNVRSREVRWCLKSYGLFRVHQGSVRGGKVLLAGATPVQRTRGLLLFPLDVAATDGSRQRIGEAPVGPVTAATWSADGRFIGFSSYNFRAYVFDSATGTRLELPRHSDIVNSISFSTDGNQVVTTSQDGRARVFTQDGRPLAQLRAFSTSLFSAVFAPGSSDRVLTGGQDGTARIWQINEAEASSITVAAHKDEVRSAAFSPDGSFVVTASVDGTARVWTATRATDDASQPMPLVTLQGHQGAVTGAAFSPSGDEIVTSSLDGTLRLWRVGDLWHSDVTRIRSSGASSSRANFVD